MMAFYYFADLLDRESRTIEQTGALQHRRLAVTLLSCVRTHAATWQAFRDKAAQLQADIEGVLPAEVFAAAQQEGDNRTVAELVGIAAGGGAQCAARSVITRLSKPPGQPCTQ